MRRGHFAHVPCAIEGVEAVEANSRHAFGRHMHDQFGIGLIVRGAQKSHSGRGMVEAGAGDIITVNPGEVHDGAPIGDHGRQWMILYIDPAVAARASADIGAARHGWREFAQPVIRDTRLALRFRKLYMAATAAGAGAGALAQESLLLALLAGTLDFPAPTVESPAVPAAVARARALIDDAPAAQVLLADLAGASGLSRFQILRAFSRATGLTPHAYQMQRRAGLARRLIRQGHGLADTAAASGFADQSHLNRVFVRLYGLTPGAYANRAEQRIIKTVPDTQSVRHPDAASPGT
ncbi:AraC family transcriptional regulator [Bordetella petrii]|uniref:AraC family transcriptional regulator n=1 Tax=Bordetella petrii TaxID=94624 RepID=UPI001E5474E0|nr:AraC family transcriptional regulator [Bordetella petrii]MCD0502694.1 AraC family transcriptional regulator [Bordetella petrii]